MANKYDFKVGDIIIESFSGNRNIIQTIFLVVSVEENWDVYDPNGIVPNDCAIYGYRFDTNTKYIRIEFPMTYKYINDYRLLKIRKNKILSLNLLSYCWDDF